MSHKDFLVGLSTHQNPLTHSVYVQEDSDRDNPIPPTSHFIITENGNNIVSETGNKLITET